MRLKRIEEWLSLQAFHLKDFLYWLYCYCFHRHNVVVAKKSRITWSDKDSLLFHCCFQILTDFIEQEKPWQFSSTAREIYYTYFKYRSGDRIDYAVKTTQDWIDIRLLYNWYKNDYVNPWDVDYNQLKDFSDRYEKHTQLLIRLVELREYYWT